MINIALYFFKSGFSNSIFWSLLFLYLGVSVSSQSMASDNWEIRSNIPVPLMGLHAATIKNQIYLMGGRHNGDITTTDISQAQAKMWRLDPVKDDWAELQPMPTARAFFDTAVIDEKLYAVGGTSVVSERSNGIAVVEMYDPTNDVWDQITDLPTSRADLTVSAANGRLYAIGGARKVGINALGTVEEYDPIADTWQRKAEMPSPRLHLASTAVDNKIYVLGGGPEWPVPSAILEIYDPATNSWTRGPDMPTERTGLLATSLDGNIYVTGGIGWDTTVLSTVEMYDTKTGVWSTLADLNIPRMLHATTAAASRVFVLGGAASDYSSLDSVEEFEP